ncbi:hypothetical protein GFK26_12675 [Variovorax paradoxus]|uniref:Uncharacterized protein n=1 Tax=Variovorax paradoxus TaxID=34073 RepID=A0A5Q0M292_VARPD|nr:hypothetical protein [Variovorax paradoxus]QFZ83549.1 hypothetical protein GFK26_12675 [Variovorax paradoxus]
MSHPVYLSSSSLPRMPEGSRDEWRGFFGDGAELEANAFFPLFWRALFSAGDIRHARFIDAYDISDEASAVDREECLADFGAEATFPYLVVDKATAVARLTQRREAVIGAVGERHRPIYESFEALIAQHFADHILLRTDGLPDAADAEPWLRADLDGVDHLHDSQALASLMADLARYDTDPIWTLAGLSSSSDGAWPPAQLRERFPDPRQRKTRKPLPTQQAETSDRVFANPKPQVARNWLDPALEWLGAFVAAGAALGAYYFTSSAWLAVLAFLCVAVALGFGIAKLRGR